MKNSQDSISPRSSALPRNLPAFSARYSRMALLSNTRTSLPLAPSVSMRAGSLPFGLTARNEAACCSPFIVSTGITSYGIPVSSRNRATLAGLGVGWKYRRIIASPRCCRPDGKVGRAVALPHAGGPILERANYYPRSEPVSSRSRSAGHSASAAAARAAASPTAKIGAWLPGRGEQPRQQEPRRCLRRAPRRGTGPPKLGRGITRHLPSPRISASALTPPAVPPPQTEDAISAGVAVDSNGSRSAATCTAVSTPSARTVPTRSARRPNRGRAARHGGAIQEPEPGGTRRAMAQAAGDEVRPPNHVRRGSDGGQRVDRQQAPYARPCLAPGTRHGRGRIRQGPQLPGRGRQGQRRASQRQPGRGQPERHQHRHEHRARHDADAHTGEQADRPPARATAPARRPGPRAPPSPSAARPARPTARAMVGTRPAPRARRTGQS